MSQSESEGLGTRQVSGASLSPRAGEAHVPAQQSGGEANSSFPCLVLSRLAVN